jgi:DNA-binding LacI/PurR family transcriptional regulator
MKTMRISLAKMFLEMLHSDEDMSEKEIIIKPKLVIRESSRRVSE